MAVVDWELLVGGLVPAFEVGVEYVMPVVVVVVGVRLVWGVFKGWTATGGGGLSDDAKDRIREQARRGPWGPV
jgi:hypothetical protein